MKKQSLSSKAQSFGGKQKDFPIQQCLIHGLKKVSLGTTGIALVKHRLQSFMSSKLKINFFVLLRVDLSASQAPFIGVKNSANFVRALRFWGRQQSFGFKKLLDTCLRLSLIDEVVSRRCKLRKTCE